MIAELSCLRRRGVRNARRRAVDDVNEEGVIEELKVRSLLG